MRFHRADLPFETSQAIYDRMKSERQREAKELRAQGYEWAQQIQAKADRDRTVILSEAQRAAAIAAAKATPRPTARSPTPSRKDPNFYTIFRALQTYKGALANSGPTLIVRPDADFMRLLKAGPAGERPKRGRSREDRADAAARPTPAGARGSDRRRPPRSSCSCRSSSSTCCSAPTTRS